MNNGERIQLLQEALDELVSAIQSVLASGEQIPDDVMGMLGEEIEATLQEIEMLSQETENEETPPGPGPVEQPQNPSVPSGGAVPPLEQAPHPSSNINAFRYDPASKKLFIKFQGKYPSQNGPVYSYEGVPANLFNLLRRGAVAPRTSGRNAWHRWREGVTPSHGAAAYALIREGGFPYQRLT